MFLTYAAVVSLLLSLSLSASIKRRDGPVNEGRFIVVLKDGASRKVSLQALNDLVIPHGDASSFKQVIYSDWSVINGYAAKLGGSALDHVLHDPNVDYVEEDARVHISSEPTLPTWNQSETRDHLIAAGDLGEGTNIFSIDTGIRVTHASFGGRATWGAVFGGYPQQDGNGHGTHTASVAAGVGFGPATLANVIAVKVLDDGGSGTTADVISGINFAVTNTLSSGKPGIINLSLGGGPSNAIDAAVRNGIAAGVHFTIAAGGSNTDAGTTSPARVEQAITVGAITAQKVKSSSSNFGSVLDVWFLGVSVTGAWITSDTSTNALSGSSLSAPGVAGILAVAISRYGNKSPADLQADLKLHAIPDVTGVPAGTTNLRAVQW